MGRIKVLHIIGGGEFGGAEEYLLTLFKNFDQSRFELHAVCLFAKPLAPLLAESGFPVHICEMHSKFDLKPVSSMTALIKNLGFDVIHTHGVRANLVGRLAARKAGVRHVVTTVHSILAFDYQRWVDRFINRVCENRTRGITRAFIAISEMMARQLVSEGVPREKIRVIHNGLALEKYKPDTDGSVVRRELGLAPDAPVVGIVARLHPVKGHKYLLQAFAGMAGDIPGLILLVVGAGLEKPALRQLADRLGIADRVIFTGFRQDIPQVVAAVDVLAVPSISEGLGLTVMEGMAMGKPVVASQVGGIPEIITPGIDGLLVPAADAAALAQAIRSVLNDVDLARRLGLAGRNTIENRFSACNMAAKTAQVYEQLVEVDKL